MSGFKKLDVDAELRNLIGTPAKVANPANPEPTFRNIRNFRNPSPSIRQFPQTLYDELAEATPPAKALEVFSDWLALLIKSNVLGFSVWVVRDHVHGLALAKETGHPALMLDDVIRLKGWSEEETLAALLPVLIMVEQ